MKRFVALLRGINVGGRASLPMRELVQIFEGLGLKQVRTYIQSGNVVFHSDQENLPNLSAQIRTAITKHCGVSPQVLLLKSEELESAVRANPYPKAEAEPKSLHLYFLTAEPENPDLQTLQNLKTDSERFKLLGNVFYLHAPDGIGRSKLAARVEKALGVPVTARNWRTVNKIIAMAQ